MTCFDKSKKNNYGYTLIELIVVIAIMSIFTGGASLGISLLFSKDAANCATKLNDAIYKTRMDSMSKTGKYELTVDNADPANKAVIALDGTTVDTVYLDGTNTTKKTTVSVKFVTESNPSGQSLTMPLNIEFDKAKGNVAFDIDGDGSNDDGIIVFEIQAVRGGRESKVQLVTATGKHTIGEFE